MNIRVTRDTRKRNHWVRLEAGGYTVQAAVYDEPSKHGLDGGRVSKLFIGKPCHDGRGLYDWLYAFDRGKTDRWSNTAPKDVVMAVVAFLEALPPVHAVEGMVCTPVTVHDLIPGFGSYVHDMEQNLRMDAATWADYEHNPVPFLLDLVLDFGDFGDIPEDKREGMALHAIRGLFRPDWTGGGE